MITSWKFTFFSVIISVLCNSCKKTEQLPEPKEIQILSVLVNKIPHKNGKYTWDVGNEPESNPDLYFKISDIHGNKDAVYSDTLINCIDSTNLSFTFKVPYKLYSSSEIFKWSLIDWDITPWEQIVTYNEDNFSSRYSNVSTQTLLYGDQRITFKLKFIF